MYEAVTRDITVRVEPVFLEDQSDAQSGHYVWAYTIEINNQGNETVRLRTRSWVITDSTGHVHRVQGEGVVGKQPVLHPGERFEYTSGAPLTTPTGFMAGSYQMESGNGDVFEVEIPAFSLDSPHHTIKVH